MKNLKRVLSLALSGIMLVGMMAVGAGAVNAEDFTDASEITHTEAVSVSTALKIIDGKEDGSFDPAGNVTRGQMAKMITRAMFGGDDPILGVKTTPTFTDIKGHWAEQYIEYCASNKIISGRGDGTFNPDGQVTGSEAAKMALTALGYDATVYGFVGTDWEINTNSYANLPDANLYDGIRTIDPSAAINRDDVAQMLYKTLDAYTKKMTPTTSTNGTIEYTYNNGGTMIEEKFNAVKVEGVVVANEVANLGKEGSDSYGDALEAGKTEIKITNYDEDPAKDEQDVYKDNTTLTLQASSDEDMLGRKVNVYVKKGTGRTKAEVLGDIILSSENVVVTDHSGDPIDDVADDNKLDIVTTGDSKTVAYKDYWDTASLTDKNTAGDLVILVDNDDDGEVEYAFVKTYVLGYVSKKSTKDDGSLTVNYGSSISFDDADKVVGFDDVEKDDYVLASVYGGKLYVTKPETVTGDLDAFKAKGDLTVDGAVYKISKAPIINSGSFALETAESWSDKKNLGNEAVFYLDANNRIVAVGEVESSASQYAISWGGAGGNKIDSTRIKLTLEDGTTDIYTINSNSDLKIGGDEGEKFTGVDADGKALGDNVSAVGVLVSYTKTSSGQMKLSLPKTEEGTTKNQVKFEKGKTMVKVADDKSGASNSSTVFFYVTLVGGSGKDKDDVDKVSAYTGYTNAPSVDEADKAAYALNSKEKVAAAMFVGSSADGAEADHLFLYKWDRTYDGYREAHVYLAGSDDHEVIKVDEGDAGKDADKLYTYSVNADGYYELTAVDGKDYFVDEAEVTDVSRNTIIAGDKEYFMTDAVVIDNIPDDDGDTPGTPDAAIGGAIAEGQTVMMIVDDDEALMIVITADVKEEEEKETYTATIEKGTFSTPNLPLTVKVTNSKKEEVTPKAIKWLKGTEEISGQTNATVNVTEAATYNVEVTIDGVDEAVKASLEVTADMLK